jgi:hypothetical protein
MAELRDDESRATNRPVSCARGGEISVEESWRTRG